MPKTLTQALRQTFGDVLLAVAFLALLPAYLYLFPAGGTSEQQWLDRVTARIAKMRAQCDDPDLQGVMDYTLRRYSRIGRFEVSVQYTVGLNPATRALGYNWPLLPGVTLDHDVLYRYPVDFGAVVLCHEAMHDYFPYLGHSHINAREEKLIELSRSVR